MIKQLILKILATLMGVANPQPKDHVLIHRSQPQKERSDVLSQRKKSSLAIRDSLIRDQTEQKKEKTHHKTKQKRHLYSAKGHGSHPIDHAQQRVRGEYTAIEPLTYEMPRHRMPIIDSYISPLIQSIHVKNDQKYVNIDINTVKMNPIFQETIKVMDYGLSHESHGASPVIQNFLIDQSCQVMDESYDSFLESIDMSSIRPTIEESSIVQQSQGRLQTDQSIQCSHPLSNSYHSITANDIGMMRESLKHNKSIQVDHHVKKLDVSIMALSHLDSYQKEREKSLLSDRDDINDSFLKDIDISSFDRGQYHNEELLHIDKSLQYGDPNRMMIEKGLQCDWQETIEKKDACVGDTKFLAPLSLHNDGNGDDSYIPWINMTSLKSDMSHVSSKEDSIGEFFPHCSFRILQSEPLEPSKTFESIVVPNVMKNESVQPDIKDLFPIERFNIHKFNIEDMPEDESEWILGGGYKTYSLLNSEIIELEESFLKEIDSIHFHAIGSGLNRFQMSQSSKVQDDPPEIINESICLQTIVVKNNKKCKIDDE